MGPTKNYANQYAKKVAEMLYDTLVLQCAEPPETRFFYLEKMCSRAARELETTNMLNFNRFKYSLLGYLHALLPEELYSYQLRDLTLTKSLRRVDRFLQLTKEQFEEELSNLFFVFDCEDF